MDRPQLQTLVRHEGEALRERSTCGWRDRLISREDADVAAWVHGAKGKLRVLVVGIPDIADDYLYYPDE